MLFVERGRSVAQSLEQTSLADSGVAHDLDQPPRARTCARERFADNAQLGVAAGERQALCRDLPRLRALRAPDRPRLDRLGFALHRERLELGRLEVRRGSIEHVGRSVNVPHLRLGHQPRSHVHRVTHDRVGAAILRTDVAREHGTAMDADPDGKRQLARDDLREREQHPLFVVASDLRCTAGQDELAAVRIDVGGEERHALLLDRGLDESHQSMQGFGRRLRTALVDQRVGTLEADECNRDRTMLGRSAAAQHVRANRGRQAAHQRLRGHRWWLGDLQCSALAGRLALEEESWPFGFAPALGGESACGLGADQNLPGARFVLERGEPAPRGSDRQEFDMRGPHRKKVELSGVHTLRHLKRDLCVG